MGGTGVVDRFLAIFSQYIDSGFGLLSGEVAFIATTLIVIDVTLAALFWSWGEQDDIIARLVKKTLFVGIFAYIIGNWSTLANIVFNCVQQALVRLLLATGVGVPVPRFDDYRLGNITHTATAKKKQQVEPEAAPASRAAGPAARTAAARPSSSPARRRGGGGRSAAARASERA